MTLVTIGLFITHFTAKWPAVEPFLAAWSFSFCAMASDSARNSVSRMRLSLRPARVPSAGFSPGLYLPVSTPRASGE